MFKDLSFGALLRGIRLKNNITMRKYCLARGFDTGNISKLERNLISPPQTMRQLKKYVAGLHYSEHEFELLLTAAQNYHIASVIRRLSKTKEEVSDD